MKLKTQLLLATTFTVLVILGASEWLNYRHTAAFVNGHEAAMTQGGDHGSMIGALEESKRSLFRDLALLHLTHAFLTVLGLVGVLHILWWRLFLRPLDHILGHIHAKGLGTWTDPIPVERSDELGDLIRAFNALGDQLAASVQQITVTSKLSAIALLGSTVVRKTALVRDHVRSIEVMLTAASQEDGSIPQPAISNLSAARGDLERITDEFDAVFAREFNAVSFALPEGREPVARELASGASFEAVDSSRWTDSGTNPGAQARYHAKSS